MWQVLLKSREKIWHALLLGTIILTYVSMLCVGPFGNVASAHAMVTGYSSTALNDCPDPAIPDTNSLLIVLLDRSGSLVVPPGEATDPDDYSTSAVRALTDLWPGKMAVIPFGNDTANVLGPVDVFSDIHAREILKNQIPMPYRILCNAR
jgi:hypothetical protein